MSEVSSLQIQQQLEQLRAEMTQLKQELAEANSLIGAIRAGEVDALLVSGAVGDQVYVLRGADQIYRVLVEEMHEGCAALSASGVILFCNRNLAEMLQTPLEELIGASFHDILQPVAWEALATCLLREQGFRAECNLRRSDGQWMPAIVSASRIHSGGDRLTCLVVTDLSAQRRSERFAQQVFEQVKQPVIVCDLQGKINQANPAAISVFGEHLLGCDFDVSIPLTAAVDGAPCPLVELAGSAAGIEVHYGQSSGRQLTLLASAVRCHPYSGDELVGYAVMFADITDRCLLATELARLDRLNLIGEIAAGIGHEVRNPLTTVRGYLQMFSRKAQYANDHRRLGLMIEELDRANSIITEFLSLAKNKAVELIPGDLNRVVETMFPLLQADAFRLGHEIRLELGEIPRLSLDEKEMRQLILNLVRNGLEAMSASGEVVIRTYTQAELLVLSVTDTGCGIPDELLAKLGMPFFTTKETGTGLGLSVCYRIAERHGAWVEVDSSAAGTTFYVKFQLP